MEKTSDKLDDHDGVKEQKQQQEEEDLEAAELILFQVSECYVYLIPPRMSAASYRAEEWNVNEWAWEGSLKVISKGEECIIKLEDKTSGELYARAFLRSGEPHPVEAVIDSSRYFVLRVEENFGGRVRHAFIGIGFRERTEGYDFQAALHDHMKYLNKKKTAEEMEQRYQKTESVDYSLKEGETIVLQLKNDKKGGGSVRSRFFEQGLNNLPQDDKTGKKELSGICLPPPPPAPLSPGNVIQKPPGTFPTNFSLDGTAKDESTLHSTKDNQSTELSSLDDDAIPEDDFGDFQAAG
ncbi:hypothetical protein MKX03_019374 [Papaver bracteatum]|nr:hypothetical protein MKX03_019374 [Papaver bracteatum]